MSSFVDSVFAFSTVQPQSVGQESVYQWKPSAEQVNVMMAEDNHTQAGIPFQFHVHYQSPAHASASAIVANLQDTSAAPSTYSQGNIDAMESSGIYSHALPVSMSLPTSMPMLLSLPLGTQQKRSRELSVSMAVGVSPSQPIFADDQSADAQRKAKRSRLIREYSNGILTHANMNSQQPASTSNGSGNGDFSGVLDDLSIPILFPDAKPAPLLIPAEDDEFDFLKMNVHDRSPAYSYPYSTTFLFKNVALSPSSAAALLIAPAANASSSSSSSFASSSPLFAAPALPSISTVSSAYDSQVLSENVESTQVTASRDMLYGYAAPMPMPLAASVSLQQPQPAVPGSLARFLPNSPTHLAIVAAVPNEVKTEAFQPEVQENAHMPALQTAQANGPAFASVSGAAAGASMITPATTAVSCSATEVGAENVSESAIGCAPSNTPRTLRSHDSRRHSLQQSAAQMHTPTGSDSPFHGQMTPSSPSSGSISSRARRPGSPQHTPSVSAVLHTSSGIAIPPLRLSAARASHRVADGDDSTRAVKQAKRITVDLTKGGVELEVFERYYQRANDGVEYKIRLIRLVNRRSGRSDVYCHAADLGGVVERKSNISRLFGQFESPREKILMNVIGAHSLSIGQESNILTYYGVRRFFDVSKMKGQMHFRRWIETVLLPDLQATTQVSAVQLLPPKNESDAQHMQIAANGQTHAQIHSVHSQAKKENQKNSGVASSRKEAGDESDHELDGPPSLSSDDESSSDSTDDLDDEADE